MNKVYVVVGQGPNDVEVPCLIFKTKEEADIYVRNNPAPEEDSELATPYFTQFYGGCGGCYNMVVKEVEFGKQFVGWNLD
jgi:hypothetical protein